MGFLDISTKYFVKLLHDPYNNYGLYAKFSSYTK